MKTKINNIINIRLYIDVLKQLRLIGFVCLGILAIISVLIPVGKAINLVQYQYKAFPMVITSSQSSIIMYLIFIILTPVLTLYIFSFLTKRNACDYFHSFPQKRGCIFNTYFAALATWIFIVTFGTALFTGITYGILSKYFVYSYINLIRFSFSIFLCAILVAATIAIACSITGTIFTNVIVTGLILFLPRLIISIAVGIITSNLSMLVPTKILPLLDYNYNLIFNTLSGVLGISASNIYQLSSVIYTVVLSIIYIGLGRLLFIKRKSETAGNPSANRVLQCIIRLSIAFPICLAPVAYIFGVVIGKSKLTSYDLFFVIVFYIFAVIVMLLYELISTKRIKNIVRALPSVIILVIMNVVILLMLNGIYQSQLNYKPSASDVKYIIEGNANTNDELDYFQNALSGKKITNKDLINLLVENLSKNIEYEKTAYPFNNFIRNVGRVSGQEYGMSSNQPSSILVTVGFKTGFTVKYRTLYLDVESYEKYNELLLSSEDIEDLYLNLPEYNKNLMSFNNALTVKENEDIYNTLKEELKNLDYNLWYSLLYEKSNTLNLFWTNNVDDKTTNTSLPLTNYTPKALLKYMNYSNKAAVAPKLMEDIKRIIDGEITIYNIHIQDYNADFTDYSDSLLIAYQTAISNKKEQLQTLYNAIDINHLTIMDSLEKDKQNLVRLDVDLHVDIGSTKDEYKYYSIYTYIDDTSFGELRKMR